MENRKLSDFNSDPFVLPSMAVTFQPHSLLIPHNTNFRVTQAERNPNNPKHTNRNLNKTWDKKFQGASCSQKLAISPAKVWVPALCCPRASSQVWLAQVRRPLPCWLSYYPSTSCSLLGQWYLPCTLAEALHLLPPTSFIISSPLWAPVSLFCLVPSNPFPMPNLGPIFTR